MVDQTIRARETVYSDFDFSFKRNPITSSIGIKRDIEAVKQSVINILNTNRGERPFRPSFGADIRSYLFENFDPVTESLLNEQIRIALGNHEPRIQVIDVNVLGRPDANEMRVSIEFEIISPDPITTNVEFVVERLR